MYKPIHPHTTHTPSPHMTDIIVAHALLEHLRKGEQVKDVYKDKELKKEVYQSPKRDNLCLKCGQPLPWCVCHLK